MSAPIVIEHAGISVVRDDLFPGGTKARFIDADLWRGAAEVVYASPAEGGAQTALAQRAAQLGKRATIFVAKRKERHPRSMMAVRLGAQLREVKPGYLKVVHARAREYAAVSGAQLLPFGLAVLGAEASIAAAARATHLEPREVWCAAGSGLLLQGLALAWPQARFVAVSVGRRLSPKELPPNTTVLISPYRFERPCGEQPPVPSDPHYDAKAWALLMKSRGDTQRGGVVFWNVTGPAL